MTKKRFWEIIEQSRRTIDPKHADGNYFEYFRSWLISMGRQVYERALKDPDSLAEVVARPGIPDFFFEEIGAVPYRVYEARTGREMPDYEVHHPRKPTGTPRDRDDEEGYFQRTFPRLWAIYGPEFSRFASPGSPS